jgi:hypothetical protein
MAKQHADKTLEKLIDYLTADEGTVYLTDQEETLLKMVEMAHTLFQAHEFPTWKINRMLCRHFDCSSQTAHMVMHDAQVIFGSRSIYNRRYMAALHLDEIIADMTKARNTGDADLLMKLHAIKNKIIELLPADAPVRDITPAVINFNIFKSEAPPARLTVAEAMTKAQELLNPSMIVIPVQNAD